MQANENEHSEVIKQLQKKYSTEILQLQSEVVELTDVNQDLTFQKDKYLEEAKQLEQEKM